MRPQVGKRAREQKTEREIKKTKARLFVEDKTKHNLSINTVYLTLSDVETAININALEQRLITKQRIIKILQKGYSIERVIQLLEEEIHIDRHRLQKYY